MTELLNLGRLYVSDFLADGEQPRAEPAELRLVMDDDTGIVHLAEQPPAELMWGRYWYRSGTNASMRAALADVVDNVIEVSRPPADHTHAPLWVDIASNDGTLLDEVRDRTFRLASRPWVRVGVDPVEGDIAEDCLRHVDELFSVPFTSQVAEWIVNSHGRADFVSCVAMFYDLLDPTDFLAGVNHLLADDGLFVLQMSYTPLMLRQLAFDNICHEHARYYTLATLSAVLAHAGFAVVDVTLNDTNGGSFRVVAQHVQAAPLRTQPWRDVALARVDSLLDWEVNNGYNTARPWKVFASRLDFLRRDVRRAITDARAEGQSVWAYGASTKGNTLLQYFGLDHTHIDAIAERQDAKVGLRTVGTDIPIVSEDEWRAARPEYTLMLPWHFVSEFTARESGYLAAGGRFIVPCPRFSVIGDGPADAIGDGRRPA